MTLPANICDIVVVHLRDSYVIVHKSAIDFCQLRHLPFSERQRRETFLALCQIWMVYEKERNEVFFLREIIDALVAVSGKRRDLLEMVICMICKALPTSEAMVDHHLCDRILRYEPDESQVTHRSAVALIRCLSQPSFDPYGDREEWRSDAAEWFLDVPPSTFSLVADELLKCALESVGRNPREGIMFASVFSEHGQHDKESKVLMAAAESARGHSLFHRMAETYHRLATVAGN